MEREWQSYDGNWAVGLQENDDDGKGGRERSCLQVEALELDFRSGVIVK
jgi:hypothetical protein